MILSAAFAATLANLLWADNQKIHLSGVYENYDIRLSGCQVTGKDFNPVNSNVSMAGCSEDFDTVEIQGGSWRSFPIPIKEGFIGNDEAWWSATNGATGWIGGPKTVTLTGESLIAITVNKADLKNGQTFEGYRGSLWRVRDSSGKVYNCSPWDWVDNGQTVTIRVNAHQPVTPGQGLWNCINPLGYSRNIKYNRFTVSGHKYFSVYFADGVSVTNSTFGPATVDYNLGFENCRNVTITNVTAFSNQTTQGNGAAVAFLYGVDGLKARGVQTDAMLITSAGWPVQNVDVDNKVIWMDEGWKNNIKENGVIRWDEVGKIPGGVK